MPSVLISRRGGDLWLVTQPGHAVLAGVLAERWGNDRFARPEPREPVLLAASLHDAGWRGYDERPAFNEEAGRPYHFPEVPVPESVVFYGKHVDALYTRDAYAGALVGMHFAGFYAARFGVQEGPPADDPVGRDVVAAQERRWVAAARDLWGYKGLRSAFEARLWHNYELLQALDFLSLFLCLVDVRVPSDRSATALPMPATLRTLDQPPGGRILPSVPTTVGGPHVDIAVAVEGPGVVALDPFPFAGPLDVEMPARAIPDRRYASEDEAAAALRAAAPITVGCRIVPGENAAGA
jgi:hypothetical protein